MRAIAIFLLGTILGFIVALATLAMMTVPV